MSLNMVVIYHKMMCKYVFKDIENMSSKIMKTFLDFKCGVNMWSYTLKCWCKHELSNREEERDVGK